jgi:tripartite-type tricarboxylate transporter receptor subunit TctC
MEILEINFSHYLTIDECDANIGRPSTETPQETNMRNHTATRRLIMQLVLGIPLVLSATQAWPQDGYPNKPIRLVVPFPAGDPPDIYARALADRLSPVLGQTIVIDNKPGAAGAIGAQEVAKAPNDGYHLLYASAASMSVIPQLRKTPYDPVKDFEPIGTTVTGIMALTVNKAFPANTWPEFVAEVKRNPRKYSIISSGDGSFLHLSAMHLMNVADIEMLHVPYRQLGQGVTDLVAGTVNASLEMSASLPHVRAGTLKAILVFDDKPNPLLPGVSNLKEQGVNFGLKPWFGVLAPAGTPAPVLQKLQAAMAQVVPNDATYRDKLPAGVYPMYVGGRDFANLMESDRNAFGAVIRKLNLKLD